MKNKNKNKIKIEQKLAELITNQSQGLFLDTVNVIRYTKEVFPFHLTEY